VLPHIQLELAPLPTQPDRLLARLVATTVAQRAQTWQMWGDAFTMSWGLHQEPLASPSQQHLIWGVLDSATSGLLAGPWQVGPHQGGESFTSLLSHPTWPQVQSLRADPCQTVEVTLDAGAGVVARAILITADADALGQLERCQQLLRAALEESYQLGLGWYRAAMAALLAELAPHHRVVLRLLLDRQTEREISGSIRRNRHTLHDHIRIIYAHYKVSSRLDLLRAVEQRIQREMFSSPAPRKVNGSAPTPWP
jgi:DNA-binding CsgD family transcriptional regulator